MNEIKNIKAGSIVYYNLGGFDGVVESIDKMGYVTWIDRDGEEFCTPFYDLTLIWTEGVTLNA